MVKVKTLSVASDLGVQMYIIYSLRIFRVNTVHHKAAFVPQYCSFIIIYASGYCGDDDDDDNLFSCDNNRCIDNQFICQSLNPCGDNSDCPYLETSYRFLDFLGNIPLIVGAIFVILFCVGFFKKWRQKTGDVPLLKSMRHSASELVGNMIDGCRGIERSPSEVG